MNFSYGVMQGRLSKIIDNKIQAFPKKHWRLEFSRAKKLGLKSIEWTLDYKDLYKNPILTYRGRKEIKQISKKYKISRDRVMQIEKRSIEKLSRPSQKSKLKKYI